MQARSPSPGFDDLADNPARASATFARTVHRLSPREM
jgi:hypothetical protein